MVSVEGHLCGRSLLPSVTCTVHDAGEQAAALTITEYCMICMIYTILCCSKRDAKTCCGSRSVSLPLTPHVSKTHASPSLAKRPHAAHGYYYQQICIQTSQPLTHGWLYYTASLPLCNRVYLTVAATTAQSTLLQQREHIRSVTLPFLPNMDTHATHLTAAQHGGDNDKTPCAVVVPRIVRGVRTLPVYRCQYANCLNCMIV